MTTKKEITHLAEMKLNELQAKYAEILGKETRSHNKTFLLRKITEALQSAGGDAFEQNVSPSANTANETPVATQPIAATTAVAEHIVESAPESVSEKLTKLTVPELQARYLEVVGRPTGSSNSSYLIWKIREARKGRVPVGPRKGARREDVTFKILPLRMEAAVVDKLDEAWKRQGLHSRMDLFRKSLHDYLACVGENEVAALLTDAVSREQ
jgi:hypothetical protein